MLDGTFEIGYLLRKSSALELLPASMSNDHRN